MSLLTDLKDGREGVVQYGSANPFEFSHILADLDQAPAQAMWGQLIFPEKAHGRVPAIVCAHGSLGWRGHHHEHMVRFLEAGIAVFRVHSFEARQVVSVVEDQMAVTMASLLVDCYRALAILRTHPRIEPERIGVTGWSLGGGVALYSAWEPLREKLMPDDGRFAAHLPFYPAAHIRPEEARWTSKPIQVLVGADDDYTPAHYVTSLIDELRPLGVDIAASIYPGAHHSFDSIDPLTFLPAAIRLGKKTVTLSRNGEMYVAGSHGERHAIGEPEERRAAFEALAPRGAHIGGSWEARRLAFPEATGFFRKHLLEGP